MSKKQELMGERDRLSELPDGILIHILSLLPTLDAVKTMSLRRFGNLWNFVHNLNFDYMDEKPFRIFVRNTLMFHQASTIDSFTLRTRIEGTSQINFVNEIHMWIKYALTKKPKIVNLHFENQGDYFPIPGFLFTNQLIVELSLRNCELEYGRGFRMGSLTSLSLYDVTCDDRNAFKEMISGFPSLRKLDMSFCGLGDIILSSETIHEFKFDDDDELYDCVVRLGVCPNLKIFDISGYMRLFVENGVSSGRIASLVYYTDHVDKEFVDHATEFLKKLENVETLKFKGPMSSDVTFPINRWRFVTLKSTCNENSQVQWIYNLVSSSLFLEKLDINPCCGSKHDEIIRDQICQEISSSCVAPHLKFVHIYSSNDHDHPVQLQLVKFLLKSAIVLDELVISQRGEQLASSKKLNLVKKFSRFSKASANAKIMLR